VAGRKAIIVLTDGLDARSSHSLDEAVESALHSDTAVYTVLVPSPILPGLKHPLTRANALRFQAMFQHKDELNLATGRTVLGKISAQTGGDEFEATPARPVNFIYQAITDELRNQYRAGLSCGAENCRPGYHALLLTTRTSGQTVQSRQGFYSGGE
jgi:VWFA-related protein